MSGLGRYLIDYENPDAGIGHSLGHVNNAIKICLRHDLKFAYAAEQVRKSNDVSLRWRLKQFMRLITLRQVHESHNIGDDINALFAFGKYAEERAFIERELRLGRLKKVLLPKTNIHIPSNDQIDDEAYREVDSVIRESLGDGVVFVLPENRTGDFEYASSREWFRRAFFSVPENNPDHSVEATGGARSLVIAVHIRRGDLLPGRQFQDLSKRMLPDAWYRRILECVAESAPGAVQVYIVSEGVEGRYCSEQGKSFSWADALAKVNCHVVEWIDKPFIDSFRMMVNCDVLIGSKSGMTHLAGMLGDQIKLVPRMWHSYRGTPNVLELGDQLENADLARVKAIIRGS